MARRKQFYCLFLFVIIVLILSYIKLTSNGYRNNISVCDGKLSDSQINIRIKQHLLKGIRYARSQATKKELFKALSLISSNINMEMSNIIHQKQSFVERSDALQDVCLEEFKGVIDHPLYNRGQIEVKCKKKPFETVLTFVIIVENCHEIANILNGIRTSYNESQVLIGIMSNANKCEYKEQRNVSIRTNINTGKDLLNILREVHTEYVLFAENIFHFDNQSNIERLVRMVSYTDVKVAAGSVRLENGKYSNGCYQMAMKMYTVKFVEGFDMSYYSCLYCDYSPAPFVTRTAFLRKLIENKKETLISMINLEIFTDLLVSENGQSFVCADVMFHRKPYELSEVSRSSFLPFVIRYELNRITFPNGHKLEFSCSEAKMSCYKQKGIMVPLCCLKELSDSLKFMNRLLMKQNVTFEVLEGTVMGGLKYNNILFWERDADTNFRVVDIDKLEDKLHEIRLKGYSMEISYECPYKRDHEKCRRAGWHGSIYYAFKTPNWRTEMYGVTFILSDFRGKLKNPTKIKIDDEWYITYTNPALYGRNIYGGDIFQHIEHYSALGISHKEYSKLFNGYYAKCPRPGFHGCLDNFAGEGNLQFLDIYI